MYLTDKKKGAIVNGKVTEVDAKGATIELADSVEGYLRVSDISVERIEDASTVLTVGDDVEAKFMGVDRKNRTISLSIKAKDQADEREAIDSLNQVEETGLSAMAAAFKNAQN
jgi:small subunit ribosomal protein S1